MCFVNHLDAVSTFRLLIILPLALTVVVIMLGAAAIHEILVALVVLGDHVSIIVFVLLLCQDFLPSRYDLVHFFLRRRRPTVRIAPCTHTDCNVLFICAILALGCLVHASLHEGILGLPFTWLGDWHG